MESTPNFAAGLQQARAELSKEGKLKENDGRIVQALLDRKEARMERALYRVHVRTRALYTKMNKVGVLDKIDWTKIVQWIKDNWMEIIRVILTVAPFILL